jgi:hypothetical protein
MPQSKLAHKNLSEGGSERVTAPTLKTTKRSVLCEGRMSLEKGYVYLQQGGK